jgi:hypothetical protein
MARVQSGASAGRAPRSGLPAIIPDCRRTRRLKFEPDGTADGQRRATALSRRAWAGTAWRRSAATSQLEVRLSRGRPRGVPAARRCQLPAISTNQVHTGGPKSAGNTKAAAKGPGGPLSGCQRTQCWTLACNAGRGVHAHGHGLQHAAARASTPLSKSLGTSRARARRCECNISLPGRHGLRLQQSASAAGNLKVLAPAQEKSPTWHMGTGTWRVSWE